MKDLFLDLVRSGASAVVVDLSRASFLDATGLALLMTLSKHIGRGGTVIVACDNPQIRKAFEVTGTDRRVTSYRMCGERSTKPMKRFLPHSRRGRRAPRRPRHRRAL